MRLGEQLVKAGLVSESDVKTALREQVVNGGRIGTNLVELGVLRIDALADALATQHACSVARVSHFEAREPALASKIDDATAARLRIVPLYLSGEQAESIVIACADPLSEDIRTQLAQTYSKQIILGIAPELRILYWLEQVYGIDRPNRFLRIEEGTPPGSSEERRKQLNTLADDTPPKPHNPLAKIAVRRIALRLSTNADEHPNPHGMEETLRAIKRCPNRKTIGELAISALKNEFSEKLNAGIIMVCRQNVALGWYGFLRSTESTFDVESIVVPLAEPSMLHTVYTQNESHAQGPLETPTPLDLRFREFLQTPAPSDMATLPISVSNTVIALLYVESNALLNELDHRDLGSLRDAISSAFKRLIQAAQR